jgi:predicted O-methyltransferase YrrM
MNTPRAGAPAVDKEAVRARLAEIGPAINAIDGWLDPNDGGVLYQLARYIAPTPSVVELGSWKGRSTAWLAHGLRDRGAGRMVAVDTWAGTTNEPEHAKLLAGYGPDQLFEEFRANLRGLGLEGRWSRGA